MFVRTTVRCSLCLPFIQGLRNDFKDAMDKLDQEYLDQLAKHEVRRVFEVHTKHLFRDTSFFYLSTDLINGVSPFFFVCLYNFVVERLIRAHAHT